VQKLKRFVKRSGQRKQSCQSVKGKPGVKKKRTVRGCRTNNGVQLFLLRKKRNKHREAVMCGEKKQCISLVRTGEKISADREFPKTRAERAGGSSKKTEKGRGGKRYMKGERRKTKQEKSSQNIIN